MAIQQPWPPADYLAPQPFDQRGCCWPWGPGGPIDKLPMRWFAGVYREDGGALAVDWSYLSLGFDFICTIEAAIRSNEGNWYTERTTNVLNTIFWQYLPDSGLWEVQVVMGNDVLPICLCEGTLTLPDGYDIFEGIVIELNTVNGPAPKPDRVLLMPWLWYQEVDPDLFHHY